jgi:Tfp pilus assembly PilM family ATPase
MVSFLKDHTYSKLSLLRRIAKWGPIGVDIGDDTVKMIQLVNNGNGNSVSLIAGGCKNQPGDVKTGTGNWQRWAIEAIRQLTANDKFRGRDVIAAMPAGELFIDHIKMPKAKEGTAPDDKMQEAIFAKTKQKLPFEPGDAMIKYVPAEENNVVIMAVERKIVDRHLAIYENANLQIKSIGVWPIALTNSYTTFFGRRKSDVQTVVMLLGIDANRTNVVICRHKNLLFARSIPIGAKQFDSDDTITRLVMELTACRRHFSSMYKKARIERVIFLAAQDESKSVCATIAKKLEMPAQMGDCLAAVKMVDPCSSGIDRRDCQINWATAFGLSLS